MVSLPGRIKPGRYDDLIETVDLMPTLFEFIGLPEPREVQGRSFAPPVAKWGALTSHTTRSVQRKRHPWKSSPAGKSGNAARKRAKRVGGTRHPDAKMVRTERWK